eukprot:COSAG02_NODE_358_length_23882_cov_25.508683_10_plen_131_part_00
MSILDLSLNSNILVASARAVAGAVKTPGGSLRRWDGYGGGVRTTTTERSEKGGLSLNPSLVTTMERSTAAAVAAAAGVTLAAGVLLSKCGQSGHGGGGGPDRLSEEAQREAAAPASPAELPCLPITQTVP